MNSDKLQAIAALAAEDLIAQFAEGERQILDVIHATASEAQAQGEDAPIKMRFAFSITLDMDENKQKNSLSFSVKHKLDSDHAIPDPDQPEFTGVVDEIKKGKR